jgi:hypothetical protein
MWFVPTHGKLGGSETMTPSVGSLNRDIPHLKLMVVASVKEQLRTNMTSIVVA